MYQVGDHLLQHHHDGKNPGGQLLLRRLWQEPQRSVFDVKAEQNPVRLGTRHPIACMRFHFNFDDGISMYKSS